LLEAAGAAGAVTVVAGAAVLTSALGASVAIADNAIVEAKIARTFFMIFPFG
jgi:hypothetical protein